MKEYRKKPVVVEADRFRLEKWLNDKSKYPMVGDKLDFTTACYRDEDRPYIPNLEGYMKISDGDYIIKGVQGEYYPCKPGIFEQTYESVN